MTDLIEQFVIKVYGSVFGHSLGVRDFTFVVNNGKKDNLKNELVLATFVYLTFKNLA